MMRESGKMVVGTRGSALALCQAEMVESALREAFPELEVERRVIVTTGDRRTDVSLKEVAKADGVWDKGVFVKELEVALERGEIDVAVHSLKDLPSDLDEGFELAGVLERAPVSDVLITKGSLGWADLKAGHTVGTSSVRRQRQVELLRPGVKVVDLRGNVPTRVRKLAEGEMDGILLAEAGLGRLGFVTDGMFEESGVELRAEALAMGEFYPAAGQGAVGLEIRAGDGESAAVLAAINHAGTMRVVRAEREFLRLLNAGCHTPVGVWTEVLGGEMRMAGRLFPEGEGLPREGEFSGRADDFKGVAAGLFEAITGGGG